MRPEMFIILLGCVIVLAVGLAYAPLLWFAWILALALVGLSIAESERLEIEKEGNHAFRPDD